MGWDIRGVVELNGMKSDSGIGCWVVVGQMSRTSHGRGVINGWLVVVDERAVASGLDELAWFPKPSVSSRPIRGGSPRDERPPTDRAAGLLPIAHDEATLTLAC